MKWGIFDIEPGYCNDEAVGVMLPLVSEQRRAEAQRYKHTFGQFCCLKSYIMLAELLKSEYGISEFPSFDFLAHGKPILHGLEHIHFSISHCKKAIAVVVADKPVGIDIESFRRADEMLLSRVMNETEIAAIRSARYPEEVFAQFWTKKEAVVKQTGDGLANTDLKNILTGTTQHIETHTETGKGYAWSLCY